MNSPDLFGFGAGIIIRLLFAYWVSTVATRKKRGAGRWAAFGFFAPLIAVIAVYCVRTITPPPVAPVAE